MMRELDNQKLVKRLLIVGIVLGFISLVLPWWMFLIFVNGEMVASFNVFLWGVVESGFYRTSRLFDWFSYITLLVMAIGVCLGVLGYHLLLKDRQKGRLLILSEGVCTMGGCAFFVGGLFFTFANPFDPYWMIAPTEGFGGFWIALLHIFEFRFIHQYNTVVFEFLSIGFFLAVTSAMLVFTTMYLSRKLSRKLTHDS